MPHQIRSHFWRQLRTFLEFQRSARLANKKTFRLFPSFLFCCNIKGKYRCTTVDKNAKCNSCIRYDKKLIGCSQRTLTYFVRESIAVQPLVIDKNAKCNSCISYEKKLIGCSQSTLAYFVRGSLDLTKLVNCYLIQHKQSNWIQSNRRSAVQWYFPLQSMWVFTGAIINIDNSWRKKSIAVFYKVPVFLSILVPPKFDPAATPSLSRSDCRYPLSAVSPLDAPCSQGWPATTTTASRVKVYEIIGKSFKVSEFSPCGVMLLSFLIGWIIWQSNQKA